MLHRILVPLLLLAAGLLSELAFAAAQDAEHWPGWRGPDQNGASRAKGLPELDGSYTLSSPIACGGRLYVRTEKALFCIVESKEKDE
ncbi:MAG: hypothetical protein GY711_04110 [bacterium]|nr:hypothetical protein [bacterium]